MKPLSAVESTPAMQGEPKPAVWFPCVRTGTGTDVFTERLAAGLQARGLRAEITWLPLRAEYAPWSVPVPQAPDWANVSVVNTWLHPRFLPKHLPVVATLHHAVHDPGLKLYKGWLRWLYHQWWVAPNERRVLHRAKQVVAVSQYVADMARQTLCDVPIQVIHNGVDTDLFQLKARAMRPHEPFRLLYVGSWKLLKGIDLLAPIMRELGDGFELNYTGGPQAETARQSMPANCHDIGRLSGAQVLEAMQAADAFLFPSRSEGLPLVVIEAMSCGLPVIAANTASLPEIVTHGETGLLCPIDDFVAFATAARTLSQDEAHRLSMSRASRLKAFIQFSDQKMLESWINVLDQNQTALG